MSDSLTRAHRIVDELNTCGVTHFIYLIDYGTRSVCDAISREGRITMIPVCREGEIFAIASGLITGGKKPVAFMQITGFMESGDSIRYLAVQMGMPLLILLGDRGWKKDEPITDSAAIFAEPILKAWGIKYYMVDAVEDTEVISKAYREAQETSQPVAILISPEK
ncbi:hypothetical protein ACFLW4_06955 [Chloroflexota bacterium]